MEIYFRNFRFPKLSVRKTEIETETETEIEIEIEVNITERFNELCTNHEDHPKLLKVERSGQLQPSRSNPVNVKK